MCLSDQLYGFIVGSDGIVAIYGVESRRSPQAEGVQYLIAGAEGGDGDNMTPGRTQPLERDTLDLKKGVIDLRCSTVKRFSNIESIQNTSIIQNGAHSPNFPVAMASSICVEAGLVENYFTTASIFSKLRQYPAIASIFILCPKIQALKTKCAIHGMHIAYGRHGFSLADGNPKSGISTAPAHFQPPHGSPQRGVASAWKHGIAEEIHKELEKHAGRLLL